MAAPRVRGGAVVLSVDRSLLLSRRRPEWRARTGARAAWAVARSSPPRRRRSDPVRAPFARRACRDAPAQLTTVTLRRGVGRLVPMVPAPPGSGGCGWGGERCVSTPCVDSSAAARHRAADARREGRGPPWGGACCGHAVSRMVPRALCPRRIIGSFESMGLSGRLVLRVLLESSTPSMSVSHFGVTRWNAVHARGISR